MNSTFRLAGLCLALVTAAPAFAIEQANTQVKEAGTVSSSTGLNDLSPSELAHSRAWGLTESEWHRYKQLMQGIRGSISPSTISPIEVLGIHARDGEERRRYAEQWAQAMREDVGRILAFQHAYDEAGKRLYPNQQLIDVTRLPLRSKKINALQVDDRVLFFTRPDCPACDVLLERLFKRIDKIGGIDIYLTGTQSGDDQAIRDWASIHSIKPEWVRTRRITLNHDAGALEKLTHGKHDLPYLMRRRGGDLSVLPASDL